MRIRQLALASNDLDKVTHGLAEVFGLKVAYNDPGIHHYGLKNAVMSAGTGFLAFAICDFSCKSVRSRRIFSARDDISSGMEAGIFN